MNEKAHSGESVTCRSARSYDESMEGGLYRVNVHIVVKGDTLWKIARQYGISFEELKKVNAHLANPDYIVPGMKIFLPEGGKGTKPHSKPHSGQPPKEKIPHMEKPAKPQTPPVPPVTKPQPQPELKPAPKPQPKPEVKPAPKPQPEVKPVPKPQPKPEVKPVPKPKPKPEIKPMPEVKPSPMPKPPEAEKPVCEKPMPAPVPHPQPPMMQPMYIGIPCGWMPIYDADCYPYGHQHLPPAQEMPVPPMSPPVQPAPMTPPMLPQDMQGPPHMSPLPESPDMNDCPPDESPIKPGQFPGMSPSDCETDHCESSYHRPPAHESSGFDLTPPAYCPPENGYVPQPIPHQPPYQQPQFQQPVYQQPNYPMPGIQASQHPNYMHLCTSCGSQMSPYPYYGMVPYMAPMPSMMPGAQYPEMPGYGQEQTDPMDNC
ncbi:SafA/ExsA family spore coat assembly protein [Sporosarcina koreensis]|uniref:SafA/ExsA family spore coat assembly protein n=1 Tax=Sporosarcina koreensis TaxID=334735 RepID=UPI000694CFFC|nr:SafA/ExsA family spore coat assembly protein [Sporosarcina koreensis]